MEVAIGLPSTIPGVESRQITDWARLADDAGFSSLGTIDRIVYPNYEPLIALSAAAVVTERIRLVSSVLLAPLRNNDALLAKQALSLQDLSGGRLVLGLAVGGREDDYIASKIDFHTRGSYFERQLENLQRFFAGEHVGFAGAIGPSQLPPPQIIIGGSVDATFRRAARYGDGWIMGGAPPDQFPPQLEELQAAWREEGREGRPRAMALNYFSLGPDAEENAQRYLTDYYGILGEELAGYIASGAAKSPEEIQRRNLLFEEAGCDELIWFPCSPDPAQVGLLADAVASKA
jgi:alkanesulfonate monooxygenase SsuD/methylene tetrahydromethanopterin reductase-like flavin-dependent oxidoreductase (luciferase family)